LTLLRFDHRARDEIDREVAWYDSRGAGLKERLVAEVEEALDAIVTRPSTCPIVRRMRSGPVIRKAPLRRFPFALVFAIEGERAVVIAFAHHGRNPLYWKGRLKRSDQRP